MNRDFVDDILHGQDLPRQLMAYDLDAYDDQFALPGYCEYPSVDDSSDDTKSNKCIDSL